MTDGSRIHALVCALVVLLGSAAFAAPKAKKPLYVSQEFVEPNRTPPATLAEMVRESDLVAIVRVDPSPQSERVATPGPELLLNTVWKLQVQEVFRSKDQRVVPGGIIELWQAGGSYEHPDRIEKQEVQGAVQLRPGDEFLVFLNWYEPRRIYVADFGAAALWRLENGIVRASHDYGVSKRQNGRPQAEVIAELDSLSK